MGIRSQRQSAVHVWKIALKLLRFPLSFRLHLKCRIFALINPRCNSRRNCLCLIQISNQCPAPVISYNLSHERRMIIWFNSSRYCILWWWLRRPKFQYRIRQKSFLQLNMPNSANVCHSDDSIFTTVWHDQISYFNLCFPEVTGARSRCGHEARGWCLQFPKIIPSGLKCVLTGASTAPPMVFQVSIFVEKLSHY